MSLRDTVKSYFTTGGSPPISSPQAPWDPRPEFLLSNWALAVSPSVTSSLTRGWVCHVQLLLGLASAAIPNPAGLMTTFYCLTFETPATWRARSLQVKVKVTLRLAVYRQSFRLGVKPLETRDQRFFQLNPCGNSPYVTSSLTKRWVRLLGICLNFRQVYISHI
jgi:hypothetical protein